MLAIATLEAQKAADEAWEDAGDAPTVDDVEYEAYLQLLADNLTDATAAATTLAELEDQALELAANKATDEEVIDALWELLSLTDPLDPAPAIVE
ncbi:MAG: hypothetical protein AAED33_10875 [Paracoccaceae bacterium]